MQKVTVSFDNQENTSGKTQQKLGVADYDALERRMIKATGMLPALLEGEEQYLDAAQTYIKNIL